MTKKDLTGGIANLLTGADQTVTKQREESDKASTMQEASLFMESETGLIDTIEDEEFRKELENRLKQKRLIGRGRPRKNDQFGKRTDGYERTSLIIQKEKWAKIKKIAFIETLTMKEIVELALDMVIERYESKHGEVSTYPEIKRDIKDIF